MNRRGNIFGPSVVLFAQAACFLLALLIDSEHAAAQGTPRVAARQPVAMVLEVRGPVTLQAGGSTRPAKHGDMVRPADQIQTAVGSQLKLMFFGDLHRELIQAPVTVNDQSCEPARAVQREDPPHQVVAARRPEDSAPAAEALQSTKTNLRWLGANLRRDGTAAAGVLRGDGFAAGPVITPSFDTTVLSDRPALGWPEQGEGARYTIFVTISGTDRKAWAADKERKIPKLNYPADEPPLKRGQKYDWTVQGKKADGEDFSLFGGFLVATAEEAQDLAPLTALAASNKAEQLLLAAAALEEHGIFDDALAIYERLGRSFPDEPALLLACVRGYERAGDQEALKQTLVACAAAYNREGNPDAAAPLLRKARDLGWRAESPEGK